MICAIPSLPASPSPILLLSLSYNTTLEPGSAVTSTVGVVPALPVKSVVITGLAGGVLSVAFLGSDASEKS